MKKNYLKHITYTALALTAFISGTKAQTSTTFSYTGSMQTFTVPACVTSITVDAIGSKGGDNVSSNPNDPGGAGGRVTCVYPVTTGQVLNIFVGGIPYNGGGAVLGTVGAPGGGASDIRIGGTALTDRVIVAGGGGGGGNNCGSVIEPGGMGGGLIGGDGWQCNQQTGANGKGGTQTTGGGTTTNPTSPGTPGVLGVGGNAGSTSGGGGGGGYYGGGGAAFGSGGGGSSYTNASATSVVHTQGFQNGTGLVTITYASLVPVLTIASASVCSGNSIILTVNAGSGTSYMWSTGATTPTISVSPTVTSTYTVSGTNTCGTSSVTTTVSVISTPVISLPTSTSICGSGTVTLTAAGTPGLSYSWNTGANTAGISVSPAATTSYTVSGTNACGTATAVTTVSVTISPAVTAASSSPTLCTGNQAILTANANTGVNYLWNTGATTASISVSPATTTAYSVSVTNACGTATTSITQQVSICTGIETIAGAESINLYPNPASDYINIAVSSYLGYGETIIEITDAFGKLVMVGSLNEEVNTLNISHFKQGIYFYRILSNNQVIKSGKAVKQ